MSAANEDEGEVAPAASTPTVVIVSGLSGSGKSVALKTFEDLDYYCGTPAGGVMQASCAADRDDVLPQRRGGHSTCAIAQRLSKLRRRAAGAERGWARPALLRRQRRVRCALLETRRKHRGPLPFPSRSRSPRARITARCGRKPGHHRYHRAHVPPVTARSSPSSRSTRRARPAVQSFAYSAACPRTRTSCSKQGHANRTGTRCCASCPVARRGAGLPRCATEVASTWTRFKPPRQWLPPARGDPQLCTIASVHRRKHRSVYIASAAQHAREQAGRSGDVHRELIERTGSRRAPRRQEWRCRDGNGLIVALPPALRLLNVPQACAFCW